MARDLQEVTVGIEPGTFSNYVPLTGGGKGVLPNAIVSQRGEFDVDGSGVGDTADTRITFPLPADQAWQLVDFHLQLHDTSEYDKCLLEMTIRPPPVQTGSAQLLRFPLVQSDFWDHEVAATTFHQYLFACANFNSPGADSAIVTGIQGPGAILFYNNTQSFASPVIWLGAGDATAVTGGSCKFNVLWVGYTKEQCDAAPMWAGAQPRGIG